MPIELWFPTPIYYQNFDDSVDKPAMDLEIHQALEEYRNKLAYPWPDEIPTSFVYGRENKFLNCCGLLTSYILKHTREYVTQLTTGYNTTEITESWVNVGIKNSYQNYHKHAGSDIAGVYYYKTQGDDGDLVFRSDSTGLEMSRLGGHRTVTYPPQEGRLILFPAFLDHRVAINKTLSERISIAFNILIS